MTEGYFQKYNKYLNGNELDSNSFFSNQFDDTIFTNDIEIDGVYSKAAVKQEKKSEDKKIILPPETKVNIGALVQIEDSIYLVLDFLGEGIYEIYPTAKLKLCNSTILLKSDKTSILIGRDEFERPIYKDEYTEKNEPCIMESRFTSTRTDEQIAIPEGKILITLKYQVAENLRLGERFIMFAEPYKIIHIDYAKVINGIGFITITGEREVK